MKTEISKSIKGIILISFLLLCSVVTCDSIIPDKFPYYALSTAYFLILSVVLLRFFYEKTIGGGLMRAMLITVAALIMFWFLLRGAKYNLFWNKESIRRFIWYMYYIPEILISLFSFFIAISVDMAEGKHINKKWHLLTLTAALMIVLVLTNDYHQLVFSFESSFYNWDASYSYGILFYFICAFIYVLFVASFAAMFIKCSLTYSKKLAWIAMIPFLVGVPLLIMSQKGLFSINGYSFLGTTEISCYMVATFLCTCINIGLIPSNDEHETVFKNSSLNIAIVDNKGNIIYSSRNNDFQTYKKYYEDSIEEDIKDSNKNTIENSIESPDEKDILTKKYNFRNGYAIWKEDISELNKVNEDLKDAYEKLSEERELLRLENDLKEENAKVKVRTQLYDVIIKRVSGTTRKIHELTLDTGDERKRNAKYICFLGAFIKRYANLMLMNEDKKLILVNELGLAIRESLRYLNYMGIPGEFVMDKENTLYEDGEILINAYEIFQRIVEDSIDELQGLYARISSFDGNDGTERLLLKINCEGVIVDRRSLVSEIIPQENIDVKYEDGISFIRIFLNKEGTL